MADRTIKITLDANISGLQSKMKAAQSSVQTFASNASAYISKNEQSISRVASGLTKFGLAGVAAFGLVVAKYAEFDAAMSDVQAATHESAASMGALREAALQAGADTQYSATEAANAVGELAKAGVSTSNILSGGLKGSLDLAAAGQLDVASAAEIASTALTQFKLNGSDVGHVADLLAAGAGKAQGDVTDLGAALKQSGLVAAQTGLSIEETTGTLSAFAAAGLLGSDAGTSFKSMLQRLTPQSKEAQVTMDELGISAYDAQGNFIGLAKFAGNLQSALKDLTPEQRNAAMATIFGSDAVRAASVLYEQGEQGIKDWIAAVDDQGYAAETAALKTDNLKGDLERLGGSFDTAAIKAGEAANGGLRVVVQALTDLLDVAGEHGDVTGTIISIVGALGGLALVAGGVMKGAVALNEFKLAAEALNIPLGTIGKTGLKASVAIAAVAAAAAAARAIGGQYQSSLDGQKLSAEGMSNALEHLAATGEISTSMNQSLAASMRHSSSSGADLLEVFAGLESSGGGFTEWLETQTAHLAGLTGSLEGSRQELSKMDEALAGMDAGKAASAFAQIRSEAEAVGTSTSELLGFFPEYKAQLEGAAQSVGVYNLSQQELLDWMSGTVPESVAAAQALAELGFAHADAGASADDQRSKLQALMQTMQEQADIAIAASNSQIGYARALDRMNEAAQSTDIVINSVTGEIDNFANEASRDANEALNRMVTGFQQYASDAAKAGAGTEELTAMTQSARDQFVQAATQMGINGDVANQLADKYKLIPGQVVTDFSVPGADTSKISVEDLDKAIQALPAEKQAWIKSEFNRGGVDAALTAIASVQDKTVTIRTNYVVSGYNTISTGARDFKESATGGAIFGPGTSTSDSIPAMLSDGEFVLRTWAARQIGYDRLAMMNATGMVSMPGYASGGVVQSQPRQVMQMPDVLTRADLDGLSIEITDPKGVMGNTYAARLVLASKRL